MLHFDPYKRRSSTRRTRINGKPALECLGAIDVRRGDIGAEDPVGSANSRLPIRVPMARIGSSRVERPPERRKRGGKRCQSSGSSNHNCRRGAAVWIVVPGATSGRRDRGRSPERVDYLRTAGRRPERFGESYSNRHGHIWHRNKLARFDDHWEVDGETAEGGVGIFGRWSLHPVAGCRIVRATSSFRLVPGRDRSARIATEKPALNPD